jgi:hypothetical protein
MSMRIIHLFACEELWNTVWSGDAGHKSDQISRGLKLVPRTTFFKGGCMKKEMKKLLAGLGVAGLLSTGGIGLPGAMAAGSG